LNKTVKRLEELILSEMSRSNVDFVRDVVLSTHGLFDRLFEMVIANKEPLSRRAIWSLDYCCEKRPELITDYHKLQLIKKFHEFSHPGLQRHSLRILARYEIPETKAGEFVSLCFDLLLDPKTSIASRAWCMDILYKFSQKEPDLKSELITAIEFQQENASAGIKNKSRRMLKKLHLET
jgi:hypothetical protein